MDSQSFIFSFFIPIKDVYFRPKFCCFKLSLQMPQNVEIKARCANPERIHEILKKQNARFIGVDRQVDTYFNVSEGRLKLREGNIENMLIFYRRNNQSGPKKSAILLYPFHGNTTLKEILSATNGVKVVVSKERSIYFIHNVKFHVDSVAGLGTFLEIEAIDRTDTFSLEKLEEQCRFYMELLEIDEMDLIEVSYSDLLLTQKSAQ